MPPPPRTSRSAVRPASPPASLPALLLLGFLLALPHPGASQSVGVTLGLGGSDYRELASPVSLGVHAGWPLAGWLRARGDYRRYADHQEWRPSICSGLVEPGRACPDDTFDGDFTLHAAGVGLVLAPPIPGRLAVEAGVQRSVTWADGEWRARSHAAAVGGRASCRARRSAVDWTHATARDARRPGRTLPHPTPGVRMSATSTNVEILRGAHAAGPGTARAPLRGGRP